MVDHTQAQIIRPDNAALEWRGAIEVEHTAEWSRAWRLPYRHIGLFPGDVLRERATMGAGVRICLRTDSTSIAGVVLDSDRNEETSPVDLVVDGDYSATAEIVADRLEFRDLPPGMKEVEIWLPQFGELCLARLELSPGARVNAPEPSPRPKIITYGSSITHCRAASSPTRTWPALLARELGLDLTCLGFGGQAHLDPMVARMIRDHPADVITACLGINVHNQGSFTARTFLPAVLGFLTTIRDGHPDLPILVMSPIISPEREDDPGPGAMRLRDIRRDVETAVDLLAQYGDTNIHLLSGLDVIGPDETSMLWDGLHPDAEGYQLMARKITSVVRKLL